MLRYPMVSESPLSACWRCNKFLINELRLSLCGSFPKTIGLQRLLAENNEYRLSIDDQRLRSLSGRLIKDDPEIAKRDAASENICQAKRDDDKSKGFAYGGCRGLHLRYIALGDRGLA